MARKSFRILKFFLAGIVLFGILIPLHAAKTPCIWENVEKIVAVGDIHGDFDNFVKILKRKGLVDENMDWAGGTTHLVQTGDIIDRGNRAKDVYDLIKKLEEQAQAAGGMVHMLIGNHEEMNITGMALRQPGYVTVAQFLSFVSPKYKEKKEKEFLNLVEKASKKRTNTDNPPPTPEEYWTRLIRGDPMAQYEYTIGFNKNYGKWILEHNTVIKINGIVFVHGGISEKYSTWSLEKINTTMRRELDSLRLAYKHREAPGFKRKIAYQPDSPVWYRDLALNHEQEFQGVLDRILENLEAKAMVIAHTPQTMSPVVPLEEEVKRFGGKLWIIDTGISEVYGGVLSALSIVDGKFHFESWRDE
ncbi:MAG: metallophosphoesterase [Candidatus Aminicenantales bacterium]